MLLGESLLLKSLIRDKKLTRVPHYVEHGVEIKN